MATSLPLQFLCSETALYKKRDERRIPTPENLKPVHQILRRSLLVSIPFTTLLLAEGSLPAPSIALPPADDIFLPKIFRGKLGFSFQFPDGFITASNRSGDEGRQQDGSQSVALVGDFATFDTINVSRFPLNLVQDAHSVVELAERLITPGNVRTQFLNATMREDIPFTIASEIAHYDFEYVVEICRGNLEEGIGGIPDCISPSDGSLLQTVIRHNVASAVLHNGEFWVVSGSSLEKRWPLMASSFHKVMNSFQFV